MSSDDFRSPALMRRCLWSRDVPMCRYSVSLHHLSDLIRMERIKVRQQKFKRGKEKMLSIAQESGDGQTLVQPEDDDDDGMTKPARNCRTNLMTCGV